MEIIYKKSKQNITMRRQEFIKELRENLFGLSEEDINEIVEDYEEHFKIGKKKKRKESEIAKSLGNPKEIAREAKKELIGDKSPIKEGLREVWINLKATSKEAYKTLKNIIKKNDSKTSNKPAKNKRINAWAIVGVILLNILFIIPIWIALFSTIVSLIISGIALSFSGILSILAIILSLAMPFANSLTNLFVSGLFASIGLTCLGIIITILSYLLLKVFLKLTKVYLIWSKKILVGKENEKS